DLNIFVDQISHRKLGTGIFQVCLRRRCSGPLKRRNRSAKWCGRKRYRSVPDAEASLHKLDPAPSKMLQLKIFPVAQACAQVGIAVLRVLRSCSRLPVAILENDT